MSQKRRPPPGSMPAKLARKVDDDGEFCRTKKKKKNDNYKFIEQRMILFFEWNYYHHLISRFGFTGEANDFEAQLAMMEEFEAEEKVLTQVDPSQASIFFFHLSSHSHILIRDTLLFSSSCYNVLLRLICLISVSTR